jgi:hypothetical protein
MSMTLPGLKKAGVHLVLAWANELLVLTEVSFEFAR